MYMGGERVGWDGKRLAVKILGRLGRWRYLLLAELRSRTYLNAKKILDILDIGLELEHALALAAAQKDVKGNVQVGFVLL